jgi:DNA-binding IclR family transcriptional regulator
MAGNSADAGRSVTSKVIAILLSFTSGSIYSLTEIARLSGLPISTAHRLATELAAWGMLERTDDGHYRVGMQLKLIASCSTHLMPGLHERARRAMEDLAVVNTRSTVRLGVLDNLEVAYVEKGEGNRPVANAPEPTPLAVHASAMGKALLAFSPPDVVDEVIARGLPRYTPFTITTPDRLRRSLAISRLTRVAVSRRELDLRSSAVAAPVFGPGGVIVAALELEVIDSQDLRLVQPPLVVAARALSRELQANQALPHFAGGPAWPADTILPTHDTALTRRYFGRPEPRLTPAATIAREETPGHRSAPDGGLPRPGSAAAPPHPRRSP